MADEATQDAVDEAVGSQDADESTVGDQQQGEADEQGAEALGDAGKQALDRMKARLKASETARKAAERERDEAKGITEQEKAQREAEAAALAKANDRILRSEVKAAAKGVLADPADAYKFLDLTEFEVDDDGNVDEEAIAEALANLVKTKPYLAAVAQGQQQRFQGSADQGARNVTHKSEEQQLTEALKEAQKAHDVPRSIQIQQRLATIRSESRTA